MEGYRKALLYFARKCDWDTFHAKAGTLFDYIEAVEFQELERRFFTWFTLILFVLILAVIALFSVDFQVHREWLRHKYLFILSALAVSSYELFFYVNYRYYIRGKTCCYGRRRERFIRGIEQDFKNFSREAEARAA